MVKTNPWKGVTRSDRCPICGRGDYCSVSDDGSAAICMRVMSDRMTRNGGYLHYLNGKPRSPRHWRGIRTVFARSRKASRPDLSDLASSYTGAAHPYHVEQLADRLGVSAQSLERLGIGWAYDGGNAGLFDAGDVLRTASRVWAFPMRSSDGDVVGIRLRAPDGSKFSAKGGREGLFLPADLPTGEPLFITEGPTDCAALLDMGFTAVGRPSCNGGVGLLAQLVKQRGQRDVVIVADADTPGQRGAAALASVLVVYVVTVKTIFPPNGIKDMRAWKCAGATSDDVRAAVDVATALKLAMTARLVGRKGAA
jgi:hypothetical protein